jgi:hypothetical protein
MVQRFIEIVAEYKERMRAIMPFIDDGSYDRQFMREDSGPNEFLTFLFCNNDLAIQFLKDVGLLRRKVQCNKCDRDMTWCVSGDKNGYRWRCRKKFGGTMCNSSRSIRYGSCFTRSNLTFKEVMYIMSDILCRDRANQIQQEHSFGKQTVTDWGTFCRETMLVFLESCSAKIGGPNKIVEIDESKSSGFSPGLRHKVR